MKSKRRNVNNAQVRGIVKSMLNAQLENKVIINSIVAAATPTAGTVLNLSNDIVQGDNFNQRSGDIVSPLSHVVRISSKAITNSQLTRAIVFQDHFNQGTVPTVLNVLNTADVLSPYNSLTVYQQKRFRILYDVTLTLPINGESVKTRVKKLPKIGKIYYNGATAVTASNGKGAVFILVIADNSTGEYDFSWEMNYHDA